MREAIGEQWRAYIESGAFIADLQMLEPSTRAILMEKYAQYLAPKMKSTDMTVSHEVTLTIEDRLRDLCEGCD